MSPRILTALDSAKIQWYHFNAIIITGMGLFTDAYDLFSITPVSYIIGRVYYPPEEDHGDPEPGRVPAGIISVLVGIPLLGTVIGQLVFGRLGDRMGRKRVYGFSLLLMIFSSIASGFSICRTKNCTISTLCFFRFFLGVGIGGDYPLSATIMSEYSNRLTRGSFIAAVFSMQGFGILTSSAITVTVAAIFNAISRHPQKFSTDPMRSTPPEADLAWRLILMFGAIPAALTYYWRMKMPETARYTALVKQNVAQANTDMRSVMDLPTPEREETHEDHEEAVRVRSLARFDINTREFLINHGKDLILVSLIWFLVDVVFYTTVLFQSRVYKKPLENAKYMNVYKEVLQIAKYQSIIAISLTIPGYWCAVLLIDKIGRAKLQSIGFFFMAVVLLVTGLMYKNLWKDHQDFGFFAVYGLTFFFCNLGPNTTSFIVPAEMFPTRLRSTCHGIAGAMGKVGAIVGAIGFFWASRKNDGWMAGSLAALSAISAVGLLLSLLFTKETNGRSLEDNERPEIATSATENGENVVNAHRIVQFSKSSPTMESPLRRHAQ